MRRRDFMRAASAASAFSFHYCSQPARSRRPNSEVTGELKAELARLRGEYRDS